VEVTSAATVGLLGGALCLDFANTVEPRRGKGRRDYLGGYTDLVRWAEHAGAVDGEDAWRLLRSAEACPAEASAAFGRAVALREVIYRVFYAIAYGDRADDTDLKALTAAHREALAHYRIVHVQGGFGWAPVGGAEPDGPLWRVALSATRLLTSGELGRVKVCPAAAGGCDWLFYDESKNKSRRWCSMEGCGSRVKMRRLYARKRERER
jgi:predicted RNA-binding Zn ribbon-like protein